MTKMEADKLKVAKHLTQMMLWRFPAVGQETVENHVNAALDCLYMGLESRSYVGLTGPVKDCVHYVYGVKMK